MQKMMFTVIASLMLAACGGQAKESAQAESSGPHGPAAPKVKVEFSADSAYSYVERQVAFGPRTPGSDSHARCRRYLAETMRRYGVDTVMEQQALVSTWKGETLTAHNILARINPGATSRVLLLAHYDTRPWADEDPSEEYRDTPSTGPTTGPREWPCCLRPPAACRKRASTASG